MAQISAARGTPHHRGKPEDRAVWLAARNAAGSEVRQGFVGSSLPPARLHRARHLHQRRRPDGSTPRFHQEIAEDSAGRFATGENAAAYVTLDRKSTRL